MKRRARRSVASAGILLMSAMVAFAEVNLNALFGDNAVLQQNASVPIWGADRDGEKVSVRFQGQEKNRHRQKRQIAGSFQKFEGGQFV